MQDICAWIGVNDNLNKPYYSIFTNNKVPDDLTIFDTDYVAPIKSNRDAGNIPTTVGGGLIRDYDPPVTATTSNGFEYVPFNSNGVFVQNTPPPHKIMRMMEKINKAFNMYQWTMKFMDTAKGR